MMKLKFAVFVAASLSLTGCLEQDFYVRQGVTFDRYQRDTIGCATSATQSVPTNTQLSWAPYVGVYSVDTNVSLRTANLDICLRDKGYQKVTIPYCADASLTSATAAAKGPRDMNRKMAITASSCYINTQSGPFFFNPN